MKHNVKKLSNGLTVLTVPSSDAESVVVDFFVKTGSRSETQKENGISHFLEHFLFKGTKKFPSAMAISELIDSIGGEFNANTGKEHTQYYIKAAKEHLPLIFEVLTDMLQGSLLDAVELEKEKGVILEEMHMYRDIPKIEVENVLEGAMWPGEALGRNIVGTESTIKAMSRDMFVSYMERHYQTSNMILGVAGKFKPGELQGLVKKYWSRLPKNSFQKWSKTKDKQSTARFAVHHKETEQAHLSFAFKGLSYTDKLNPVATVLSSILGGGMSSRMFSEVREKRGLAYYVYAQNQNYQDIGLFNVNAGVQVGKIEEAVAVISSELARMKTQPVPEKELVKAKSYIKGMTVLALEDNQAKLDYCLGQLAFKEKISTPQEVFKRIDAVTAKDVQKLANKLFDAKRLTFAVIGPYKTDEMFKKNIQL